MFRTAVTHSIYRGVFGAPALYHPPPYCCHPRETYRVNCGVPVNGELSGPIHRVSISHHERLNVAGSAGSGRGDLGNTPSDVSAQSPWV